MYRIDNTDAATLLPAPSPAGTPGYFTMGNKSTGVLATPVDAEWIRHDSRRTRVVRRRAAAPSR